MRSVQSTFETYVKLNKRIAARDADARCRRSTSPARLADTIVAHLPLKLDDKQELLETDDRRRSGSSGSTS